MVKGQPKQREINRSAAAQKREFAIFDDIPVQASVQNVRYEFLEPQEPLPRSDIATPITFKIPSIPGEYIDPTIYLNMTIKVTTPEGKDLPNNTDGINMALLNWFINTQFRSVELYLNNTLVTSCEGYTWISYLHTLLNADRTAWSNVLQLGAGIEDDVGMQDVVKVCT